MLFEKLRRNYSFLPIVNFPMQLILDELSISDIDFFSLDVEGYELQVLKGLDFNKIKPDYILIECTHKEEIFMFMNDNQYEMIEFYNTNDYLFKKIK